MADSRKPSIYRMTYPDGTYVIGTSRMLYHASPYSANYIRLLARTGAAASNGCTVERVGIGTQDNEPRKSTAIYIATNPRDDPIIGPADEIAALTGYTVRYVLNIASNGAVTKAGWSVRRATKEEAKEAGW